MVKNSIDVCSEAFSSLVKSQAFIPSWLKEGYENGLKGGVIPSGSEIMKYTSLTLHEEIKNFKEHGFHLTPNQEQEFKDCDVFCDELINCTVRSTYGWGIPCEESISAIEILIKDKPGMIELGAGSGLWSAILKARTQKNIIACEKNLRSDTPKPKFGLVLNAGLEDIMPLYPDYPILMVWTDTNDMGEKAIEKLKPGQHLVLTGPAWITGNDKFYKLLDENFLRVSKHNSCSFSGGEQDTLYILKKNPVSNFEHDGYFTGLRNKNKIRMKLTK